MAAQYKVHVFGPDGKWLGAVSGSLPEYLDWMPIQVKAEWFRYMGSGNPLARDALIESQGEMLLIRDVTLVEVTWKQHKEKTDGAHAHIEEFIDREGYSRQPRNQ